MNAHQLEEARRELSARFPNFSTLLTFWKGRFVPTPGKKTVGVDRHMRVYFDPALDWTQDEMLGALEHELGHICRNHFQRADQYAAEKGEAVDFRRWNVAGDLEINDDLVFPLPKGYGVKPGEGQFTHLRVGGIAEGYYKQLYGKLPEPEPEQDDGEEEQPGGGNEDEDDGDTKPTSGTEADSGDTPGQQPEPQRDSSDTDSPSGPTTPGSQDDCPEGPRSDDEQPQSEEGDDQDGPPSPADAPSPNTHPEDTEHSDDHSGESETPGQDDESDSGSGTGQPSPSSPPHGDGQHTPGNSAEQGQQSEQRSQDSSAPASPSAQDEDTGEGELNQPETISSHEGDCGSVAGGPMREDELPQDDPDYPGVTPEQVERAIEEAKKATGKAMADPTSAEGKVLSQPGQGTGLASSVFGPAITDCYDHVWETVLHREAQRLMKTGGQSFQRPSRRLYDRKVIHIGRGKVAPVVAIVVDISPSIEGAEDKAFGIIQKFKGWNIKFKVVGCDEHATEVANGQAVRSHGGGTNMMNGCRFVKERFGKVDACFVITDGEDYWQKRDDETMPFPVVVFTWRYDGPDWTRTVRMPPLDENQVNSGNTGIVGKTYIERHGS